MREIIIFGAGAAGKSLLKKLDRNSVKFFVDNNTLLIGKEIEGIPIISVKMLKEIFNSEKHILVVSPENYFDDISNQLKTISIDVCVKASNFLLWNKMVRSDKKRIVLANTHMGTNIGDHLITLAEIDFFKKYLTDYEVIELTASEIEERFDDIKEYITTEDIIAVSGGGYMGSLWPVYGEYNVRRIVSGLPNNKIIIMPQSIYFENTNEGKEQLRISNEVYLFHKNLIVCIREPERLDYIDNLFGNKLNLKVYPDMVFSMERQAGCSMRKGIGLCFRTDKESLISEEKKQEIIELLDDEITLFDMHTDKLVVGFERNECINKIISMISGFRYVITDRLHCMLVCMVSGTPCIAFDNLTGKLSNVHQWIDDSSYINIVKSIEEAIAYVRQYSGNEEDKWCSWSNTYKRFEDLAKEF